MYDDIVVVYHATDYVVVADYGVVADYVLVMVLQMLSLSYSGVADDGMVMYLCWLVSASVLMQMLVSGLLILNWYNAVVADHGVKGRRRIEGCV